MERIYKVKIKSKNDPTGQYPSERRYSASTVLGLSSFHLFFALLGLIFAILSISNVSRLEGLNNLQEEVSNNKTENSTLNTIEAFEDIIPFYQYSSIASIMLSIGGLLAGFTGLLAWKRWYIDNNIKWFFFASCLSSITAGVTIICTTLTIIFFSQLQVPESVRFLRIVIGVSVHVVITSLLEFVCSLISSGVAYSGMVNVYPDDILATPAEHRGKVKVNTIYKGCKDRKIAPFDILYHMNVAEKIAKYFPKRDNGNLPKAESPAEYKDRVNKFLSSHTESSSDK